MVKCNICNNEFTDYSCLANHIKKHNITREQYYLKYIGKQICCKNCGNKTKLKSLKLGFQEFCCVKCSSIYHYHIDNIKPYIKNEEQWKQNISKGRSSLKAKEKFKNTMINRYGIDNPLANHKFKRKVEKTNIEKYGVDNPAKNNDIKKKIKNTSIKNGWQVSDKEKPNYLYYSNLVKKQTKLNKVKLFEDWDGYDYYDNEYIKENLNINFNNRNYPTIDHKISILEGFKTGKSVDEISSIDNLCITKKWINSSKYSKKCQ